MSSSLEESNMCRLCGCEDDSNQNIFDLKTPLVINNSVILTKIVDVLEKNLNLKLSEDDKLPRMICMDCRLATQALAEFLARVRQGQAYLRKLLRTQYQINETYHVLNDDQITCSMDKAILFNRKRARSKKDIVELSSSKTRKPSEEMNKIIAESPSNRDIDFECCELNIDEREGGEENLKSEVTPTKTSPPSNYVLSTSKQDKKEQLFCNVCQLPFTGLDNLNTHVKMLHSNNHVPMSVKEEERVIQEKLHQYECGLCVQSFSDKKSNKDHLSFAHSRKVYSCDMCTREFNAESSLRYHKQSAHTNNGFPCTVDGCKKVFKVKTLLNRHLKFHSDERSFSCDFCDKKFKTLSNLKQHARSHSDVKMYQCELCGQEFKQRSTLNTHKMLHTDHKKYECPTCNKRFHQIGNLREHIRSHTGEKRFKCQDCNKAFVTSSQYKKHQRTHSNIPSANTKISASPIITPAVVSLLISNDQNNLKKNQPSSLEERQLLKPVRQLSPCVDEQLLPRDQPLSPSSESQRVYSCVYCEKMFSIKKSFNAHIKSEHSDLARPNEVSLDTMLDNNEDFNDNDRTNDAKEKRLQRTINRKNKIKSSSKQSILSSQIKLNEASEKVIVEEIKADGNNDLYVNVDEEVNKQVEERSQVWNLIKSVVEQNSEIELLEEEDQVIYITYENNQDGSASSTQISQPSHSKAESANEVDIAVYLKDLHSIPVSEPN